MEDSDSGSRNKFVQSTPEGERKRVEANMREIAALLNDRHQQDMGRHHAADILALNFIRSHSDEFDDKGSDRYVYVGDDTDSHIESEDTDETDDSDNGETTDGKLTFTLESGPSDG